MNKCVIIGDSLKGLGLAGELVAAGLLAASQDTLQDGEGSHLLIFQNLFFLRDVSFLSCVAELKG